MNIKPSLEELQNFQTTLSNGIQNDANDDDYDEKDDQRVEQVIKRTLKQGGKTVYMKGDKIKILKGDLLGMIGTVIEIESGMVTFKPLDIP